MSAPEQSLVGDAITDADITAAADALHRFLARRLRNSAHVEDVCQESIARLLQARDRLDAAAATPYAFTVAKSILVAEARKADVAQRHAHRIGDHAPPPSPEDLALQLAESNAVSSALSSLPERDRQELLDHVIEGRPVAALAAESGGTAGGVAARLARTRARMRVDYLLAASDCALPAEHCHPVLVALSAGDRRRQRTLEAANHLLDCETCAALAPSLVERQRHLAGLLPIPGLAVFLGRLRRLLTPRHAAIGAAAATVAVVAAAVAVAMSSGGPRPQPAPQPLPQPVAAPAPTPTSPPPSTPPPSTPPTPTSPPPSTPPTPTPPTPTSPPPSTPPLTAPPLTSNGVSLLPLTPEGLSAHAGQPATATSVVVQPPLAPLDGLFVGDSPTDSIFVDLADSLPNTPDQPLTPYQPGQHVSFTGRLVVNTPDYITEARDSDHIANVDQIISRGYHIEALPTDIHPG